MRQLLAEQAVSWQLIWERPPLRRQHDPPERFEALADMTTAEGYRVVWFRSSEKWKRDEQWRQSAVHPPRSPQHPTIHLCPDPSLTPLQPGLDLPPEIRENAASRRAESRGNGSGFRKFPTSPSLPLQPG